MSLTRLTYAEYAERLEAEEKNRLLADKDKEQEQTNCLRNKKYKTHLYLGPPCGPSACVPWSPPWIMSREEITSTGTKIACDTREAQPPARPFPRAAAARGLRPSSDSQRRVALERVNSKVGTKRTRAGREPTSTVPKPCNFDIERKKNYSGLKKIIVRRERESGDEENTCGEGADENRAETLLFP
jgi:hypothetical protein